MALAKWTGTPCQFHARKDKYRYHLPGLTSLTRIRVHENALAAMEKTASTKRALKWKLTDIIAKSLIVGWFPGMLGNGGVNSRGERE